MTSPPPEDCALCGATWGDYWEEIGGKRLFFCCVVCAKQYRGVLSEAEKATGWDSFEGFEMEGDYRGRVCTVVRGNESRRFIISFFENGDVRTVVRLTSAKP